MTRMLGRSTVAAFALSALGLACSRPSATPTSDASAARPSSPRSPPSPPPNTSRFVLTVEDRTIDAAAGCKVFVTATQSLSRVSWHGRCKDGFADGLGVVRYAFEGIPDAHFCGQLKDGYWQSGAWVEENGTIAGQFKENERIAGKDDVADRNLTIRAFDTAAKAATELSRALDKQGNAASAKKYRALADQLANALD